MTKTVMAVSGEDLWQWRQVAIRSATAVGIAATEVDWLLREVTGLDRLALQLETFQQTASIPLQRSLADLTDLWQQRLQQRVPLQYLVGVTYWRQLTLQVSPAVLIPRPETECLIDLAIAAVAEQEALEDPHEDSSNEGITAHWADLGTGSGAIALGLALAFPQAMIHGVDWSAEALALAQHNVHTTAQMLQVLDLPDRLQFHHGSWFEPLAPLTAHLRGMVANPPYIPSGMISTLQPEVVGHEPHLALDGGDDGLDCLRHLVTTAPRYLQSGGLWLVETMAGQADTVAGLLTDQGSYRGIQVYPDLAGIDRFVLAYRI